ncbi:MAG: hypothetical protein JSS97_05945 [Actinobacteria bacterium]|nr:hypothetical protein [Actinomycetota bacterium]
MKVNFDSGHDHIAMFGPFVLDAVASISREDMTAAEVGQVIHSRDGLKIPLNTLKTLLGRAVKDGYLRREAGKYFRLDKPIDAEDVPRERIAAEHRQRRLASALREMADRQGIKLATDDEALALILCFLERYHVNLALDESPEVEEAQQDDGPTADEKATAMFLRGVVEEDGELADVLDEMLQGYVLQNTLLLKDVDAASRNFQDLRVVFDSPLLFAALGLRGTALETSTLELARLLRDTNAVLEVFETTISEMRRILAVYEEKIGTSQGRGELRPSALTRHFLGKRSQPSDVREMAGLLELRLKKLGFNIREAPTRIPEFTLDETALAKELADEPGNEQIPRVQHDVDCIAGVLTYRRGRVSASLDTAGAVFVSSGGMTVESGRSWYFRQGGKGFPPIVHVIALSNYAWLKRPASASKLKVHELMALCNAALRPSPKAWSHFVEHLRRLEVEGELSSEELTTIVASDLTENVLAERGIDDESDAESLTEVIERVKAGYKDEAEAAKDEAAGLRQGVHRTAEQIAMWASWIFVLGLAASFVTGAAVGLLGGTKSIPVICLAVVPLAVFGLLSLWNGFQLRDLRVRIQTTLAARVEVWMTEPEEATKTSE